MRGLKGIGLSLAVLALLPRAGYAQGSIVGCLDGFLLHRIGVSGNRFRLSLRRLEGFDFLQQPVIIHGGLLFQRVEQTEG